MIIVHAPRSLRSQATGPRPQLPAPKGSTVRRRVPTKANPDYTEPPEAHYLENGVRYLHALFISEPEDTPDVTGVTFVIAQTALVTVRYHPVETFDFFSQKLCKAPAQALFPDAVALGLINTGLNPSARAQQGGRKPESNRERGLQGQGRSE